MLVDLHVDGELDATSTVGFLEHIQVCPRCAEAVALAKSAREQMFSTGAHVPPGLKDVVRQRMEESGPVPVASWVNIMKTNSRIRWGVTTVATAALVATALLLVPRTAFAGGAKETWKKMEKAAAGVANVHIVNVWSANGKTGKANIWADDKRVRFETDKAVTIFKDGTSETYELFEKVTFTGETEDGQMAVGVVSPRDYDVSEQIKRLQVYGGNVVGFPEQVFKGTKAKVVGLENVTKGVRFTFLVEPKSGLPMRKVDEVKKDGKWVEVSHQDFQFNVLMPESLFQPPYKKPE